MKEFQIWMEGYSATGESCGAEFLGKQVADTFEYACIKKVGHALDRNKDGYRKIGGSLCAWGRRCFDNEADARRCFG